jgi:hypothetical protein
VAHAGEHPAVIQQDEGDGDARIARDLERRVQVGKEMRIEPRGQSAVVVGDARPSIAEHEPARHGESQRRHLREITPDRIPACRDAQVRSPHVGAEVEPVEHGLAIGRPRVIASVQVLHSSHHSIPNSQLPTPKSQITNRKSQIANRKIRYIRVPAL